MQEKHCTLVVRLEMCHNDVGCNVPVSPAGGVGPGGMAGGLYPGKRELIHFLKKYNFYSHF